MVNGHDRPLIAQATAYAQLRKLMDEDSDEYEAIVTSAKKVVGNDRIAAELANMVRIYNAGLVTRENFLRVCKDLLSGI